MVLLDIIKEVEIKSNYNIQKYMSTVSIIISIRKNVSQSIIWPQKFVI